MNTAIFDGRLTKDPESRTTSGGTSVATFTVAVTRKFKNADGNKQTDFLPVVCWKGIADNCVRFIRKGSHVLVEGEIQTRSYDANDGTKRYVTEIIANEVAFLDKKEEKTEKHEQIPGFTVVEQDELPF